MNRRGASFVVAAALVTLTAAPSLADFSKGPMRQSPVERSGGRSQFRSVDHRTILRVNAGISEPTGDFGDGLDTGLGVGGSVGYGVSRKVLLSGNMAYHRFDLTGGGGHFSVTPFTLNADVILSSSRHAMIPWIGGGFGIYHMSADLPVIVPAFPFAGISADVSENDPGMNLGVGFGVPTSPRTAFGAGLKFHHVWGDNFIDGDFVTMQFGMAFDL